MSSFSFDYSELLAIASRRYGGASPEDFKNIFSGGMDALEKIKYSRKFSELSDLSHFSIGPLFTGIPASSCGISTLNKTHAETFGTSIAIEDMSIAISAQDDSLPKSLAIKVAEQNRYQWEGILRYGLNQLIPGISSADIKKLLTASTPTNWELPVSCASLGVPEVEFRKLLSRANRAIVSSTLKKLNKKNIPGSSERSRAARCLESVYLLRCFRRTIRQGLETMYLSAQVVSNKGETHISLVSIQAWIDRMKEQEKWMSKKIVRDTHGEFPDRTLGELIPSNSSKRARLTSILVGIDKLAIENELSCAMVTLTLPAQWHPSPAHGIQHWGGAQFNPHFGSKELIEHWAVFLRDLSNVKVKISGIRVIEAHCDGSPHLHCAIYYSSADELKILEKLTTVYEVPSVVVRSYKPLIGTFSATQKSGRYKSITENYNPITGTISGGAGESRQIEFMRINRKISSGSSYVAKHVLQPLQFDLLPDQASLAARDMAVVSAAHAYTWNYRRFAMFGIRGKLTCWDELQRVKKIPSDEDAAKLWIAARKGDFANYLRLLGGLAACSSTSPIKIELMNHCRLTKFGDIGTSKLGVLIKRGKDAIFEAVTRKPGRFIIIDPDKEETKFEEYAFCMSESETIPF
jgi:hypothetical protein